MLYLYCYRVHGIGHCLLSSIKTWTFLKSIYIPQHPVPLAMPLLWVLFFALLRALWNDRSFWNFRCTGLPLNSAECSGKLHWYFLSSWLIGSKHLLPAYTTLDKCLQYCPCHEHLWSINHFCYITDCQITNYYIIIVQFSLVDNKLSMFNQVSVKYLWN